MTNIKANSWTEIKNFIDTRGLQTLHYIERLDSYELRVLDGIFVLDFTLTKSPTDSTDLNDFENNYKPYANIPLGNIGEISKERVVDAFGRFRTSQPNILFDSYFVENEKPLLFTSKTSGSGSISRNSTTSNMELLVGTTSGDKAIRQTKEYFHYVPGQSYRVLITGQFGVGKTNCLQRIGYFDDNNGLYFEYNNTTINVAKRSNVSGSIIDTKISQSNWNIDKLDGTGPSKKILDIETPQIFVVDFQWLGTGRVRFGFNIDGKDHYVHEILNANNGGEQPYMATGSLPVRIEIENTGTTSGSTTLINTCMSVISEGSEKVISSFRNVNNGIISKSVSSSAEIPLLSLRLNPSNNRSVIIPENYSTLVTTNDNVIIRLRLNGTLTGDSWITLANSIAQYDESATAITGGLEIDSDYISREGDKSVNFEKTFLKLFSDIDGNPDILTVTAQALNTTAECVASLTFKENS